MFSSGVIASLVVATTVGAADPPAPSWVFLRDKGASAAELDRAISLRLDELSLRALHRRRRIRGDIGADVRDLAPNAGYLATIESTGARLRVVSRWLNAVSVEATESQRATIAALPFVDRVQPVSRRARHAPSAPGAPRPSPQPWDPTYGRSLDHLELIGIPDLHACGLTGTGVVVGILDTGFTVGHAALAGIDVLAQHDFVNDDDVVENEADDPSGQHEHGTKVLSLLAGSEQGAFAGVAPDVRVILAKIDDLSLDAPIEDDWWVAGLEWIEATGADLVTGSIGFCDTCPAATFDGQTHPTTVAANIAMANGLIMINSAGNGGPAAGSIRAPGDAAGLIAVGSVSLTRTLAWDSSRGPTYDGRIKPDVLGPGVDVWTVDPTTLDQYVRGSGTSFAAPIVAGLAALLVQAYPNLGPFEMRALLRTTASKADTPDNDLGWGLVDGMAAAGLYCTCDDFDGDGFFDEACGGTDCADDDASVFPNAGGSCVIPDGGGPSGDSDNLSPANEAGCDCDAGAGATWLIALLLAVVTLARRRRAAPPA